MWSWVSTYTTVSFSSKQNQSVKNLRTQFEVTNKGPINDYLGVKVERRQDQSIKLSQHLLTQHIIDEMGFNQ